MKQNKRMYFIPNPDKIMIKITREQAENITRKQITREDGTKVQLFMEPEYAEGYDRRYQQNVSVGTIVGVGDNVKGIMTTDIAIVDYLVRNDDDILIGFVKGDQLVAIDPYTTYHKDNAPPFHDGRRAWVKGDFDMISGLLGVVRGEKLIAFDPYLFLEHKSNLITLVNAAGKIIETVEEISERTVLAAPKESMYKQGDVIKIREADMFSRHVMGREISVVFHRDILLKK